MAITLMAREVITDFMDHGWELPSPKSGYCALSNRPASHSEGSHRKPIALPLFTGSQPVFVLNFSHGFALISRH